MIYDYFTNSRMHYKLEPKPKCYYPNTTHTNKFQNETKKGETENAKT